MFVLYYSSSYSNPLVFLSSVVTIKPMPQLSQSTFGILKFYKDKFKHDKKIGTLLTDKLLLASGLLHYNPLLVPSKAHRPNSNLVSRTRIFTLDASRFLSFD